MLTSTASVWTFAVRAEPLCGNAVLELGEQCDDGNLTNLDGCSADCRRETHFQCYRSLVVAPQPPIPPVSLLDQFGTLTVSSVLKTRRLCMPADKNGEDPTAPSLADHLESYPVFRHQHSARFPVRNQKVVDQFGTLFVNLLRPESFLVPTAKRLGSLPAAPASPNVDHFTCYGVTRVRGIAWFTPHTVTLTDQFGTTAATVTRPRRLCAPADKNGEYPGAQTHLGHLMCYGIRGRFAPVGRVFTNNQFGPGVLYPRSRSELCVPAVKNP